MTCLVGELDVKKKRLPDGGADVAELKDWQLRTCRHVRYSNGVLARMYEPIPRLSIDPTRSYLPVTWTAVVMSQFRAGPYSSGGNPISVS